MIYPVWQLWDTFPWPLGPPHSPNPLPRAKKVGGVLCRTSGNHHFKDAGLGATVEDVTLVFRAFPSLLICLK